MFKPKVVSLIRGRNFPGAAMSNEVSDAMTTFHFFGYKSFYYLIKSEIKNLWTRFFGPSEVEQIILSSLKNDEWEYTLHPLIKHISFRKEKLTIYLSSTNMKTHYTYKGWHLFKIDIEDKPIKINYKRIMKYIVDNLIPSKVQYMWGQPSRELECQAVIEAITPNKMLND